MEEHDAEIMECDACGSQFDLARQDYYDKLCPDCNEEMEREMAEKEMEYLRQQESAAERHFERHGYRGGY